MQTGKDATPSSTTEALGLNLLKLWLAYYSNLVGGWVPARGNDDGRVWALGFFWRSGLGLIPRSLLAAWLCQYANKLASNHTKQA